MLSIKKNNQLGQMRSKYAYFEDIVWIIDLLERRYWLLENWRRTHAFVKYPYKDEAYFSQNQLWALGKSVETWLN